MKTSRGIKYISIIIPIFLGVTLSYAAVVPSREFNDVMKYGDIIAMVPAKRAIFPSTPEQIKKTNDSNRKKSKTYKPVTVKYEIKAKELVFNKIDIAEILIGAEGDILADLISGTKKNNPTKNGKDIRIGSKVEMRNKVRHVTNGKTSSLVASSSGKVPLYESASKLASVNEVSSSDQLYADKILSKKSDKEAEKIEEPNPEPSDAEPEAVKVRPEFGVSASPFLNFSRIDATDVSNGASGGVLSNPGYGADLKFLQMWKDYFTSEMFVRLEDVSYYTNSGRTFDRHGGFMFNFGAGIGYKPIKKLELKGRVFYGEEFYFRAPDTTSLAIDDTKALKGDFALKFDFFDSKYASTGIGAGGKVIFPSYVDPSGAAGYHTKFGYGFFGSFIMKQRIKCVVIDESFTFERLQKDTDLFNQTQTSIYLQVGATVEF